MYRIVTLIVLLMTMNVMADDKKQYYELREYQIAQGGNAELLDEYLTGALLPALNRIGIQPIGLFQSAPGSETDSRFVLIPLESTSMVADIKKKLLQDKTYITTARPYLDVNPESPVLQRLRSELLEAFDVLPRLAVPELCKAKQDRIFELRTYESATEHRGHLKVEMFNSGEVPIFLDCGIQPIFFGQAIVGNMMPNLTYMTVYPDESAKAEAWKRFRGHPDWKVLSRNPRYAKTVSKIHKWNLVPMKASQL